MTVAAGAYGLTLTGPLAPTEPGELFVPAPADWPPVDLSWEAAPLGSVDEAEVAITEERALLVYETGAVVVTRSPLAVRYLRPDRPDHDTLAHPGLAVAAATSAHWGGMECLHGGAVDAGGGAWGVLGQKEDGKSTLMAAMAAAGCVVLSDDMVVTDGVDVLAGPRGVDLREGSAGRFPGLRGYSVRDGLRERVLAGPCPPRVPLRGWLVLAEGPEVVLEPVPFPDRLAQLGVQRSVRLSSRVPELMLDLAARPMFRLVRPRDWGVMDQVVAAVQGL